MADLLIKGMEMPKGTDYLHLIIQGGKVHTAISCGHLTTDKLNVADAIEVKPHGRLIDVDLVSYHTITDYNLEGHNVVYLEDIKNAPTVLEAST